MHYSSQTMTLTTKVQYNELSKMSEKQKRIFFLTLALLSAVFFFGCSFMDSYGKIYRFEKNPFIFPDNLTIIKEGEIQAPWNRTDSLPLFVMYIDSMECTDCHLNHINYYNRLLEISKESQKFDMICLISPSYAQHNSLPAKLLNSNRQTKITYAIDNDCSCYDFNPCLPELSKYHNFLLDRDGFPIYVGNPLKSEKLFNQFLKLVLYKETNR